MAMCFTLVKRKPEFLFLFLKTVSRKKAKLQSLLMHKYLCYTGSLTWQLLLPHPLFPVNNANKTALICSTFTTFSDLWPVSSVCVCARVCVRARVCNCAWCMLKRCEIV